MSEFGLIIGGEKLITENTFDVINPATEEVVAKAPAALPEQLDKAVEAAQTAFVTWRQTSCEERRALIHKVADKLEQHQQELAELITAEQGKPIEAYAGQGSLFEIGGAVAWARATAELEIPVEVIQDDEAVNAELHRKPLGVVGSITPWNWPLMIAIWHVIPAIRAGNTVVIKPSEYTPLSTLRFVELANQVLPAGVLNVVAGDGSLGRQLVEHPDVAKVVFTGSSATGRHIMRGAAQNLKRLTLELGGNDAGIVLPDVDIKRVAPKIFASAFPNAGQTCAALKRLYVHDSIYDALCDELCAITKSVTVGNGAEPGVDFGPVQNRAQLDIVEELANDARKNGARFLTGNEQLEGPGFFFPITLVADIEDGSRLVDEEPFGPILPIIKYSDIEDVIQRANASDNGLGGSVWSSDLDAAKALAKRIESGSVWVNAHGAIQPNIPFGGVKQSGIGREFSTEGLLEYTETQAVITHKK